MKINSVDGITHAVLMDDGCLLPDDAPFLDRAFHAAKLATAVDNVKVAWAKRQRPEADPPVDVQAGLRALYEGRKAGEAGQLVCDADDVPPAGSQSESWWKQAREWISSPSTWWGLSTEDEAIELMKKVRGFPDISIPLPVLKGFGLDDISGPLRITVKTDRAIRLIGRVMDDVTPGVLTVIGLGVTVAPNLVKNIRNRSPWNQTAADLLVDTGGFIVSELAGWGAGALAGILTGGNPVVILATKVVVDGAVSMGWDYLAERYQWSDWLSQQLKKGARSFGKIS